MDKVIDNDRIEMYRLKIELEHSGHYTNCYIIKDKKSSDAIIIDPSYNAEFIIECLNKINANLKVIFLTHCHGDHVSALEDLYNYYKDKNVVIKIHENDRQGIFDDEKNCKYILNNPNFITLSINCIDTVSDKDMINIGGTLLEVMHTPGHTEGSVCYLVEAAIFSGGTLFQGSCGRTDLPSGDWATI